MQTGEGGWVGRQGTILLGAILLGMAVFALWPGMDLWFSGLFYRADSGFLIAGHPVTEAMRQAVWNLAIGLGLMAALGVMVAWAGGRLWLPGRLWGFILTLYILGPGVMVEAVTKPLWGRARPVDVAEFGGSAVFSPPHALVDFCTRNCSFVSGEVSGATVTALALALLGRHLRGAGGLWALAVWLIPMGVALQRVAAGRHFLSDVVFAVLLTLLLAWLLRGAERALPKAALARASGLGGRGLALQDGGEKAVGAVLGRGE